MINNKDERLSQSVILNEMECSEESPKLNMNEILPSSE